MDSIGWFLFTGGMCILMTAALWRLSKTWGDDG